jgi:hypothetical protein
MNYKEQIDGLENQEHSTPDMLPSFLAYFFKNKSKVPSEKICVMEKLLKDCKLEIVESYE